MCLSFFFVFFYIQSSDEFLHNSYHTYKELKDVSEHLFNLLQP